jgi:hypothetical protein
VDRVSSLNPAQWLNRNLMGLNKKVTIEINNNKISVFSDAWVGEIRQTHDVVETLPVRQKMVQKGILRHLQHSKILEDNLLRESNFWSYICDLEILSI